MYPALTRRASERDLVLVKTSAEALPFPDSSVDEVICSLVLCTVDDPTATIAEVLRVLRPGGTFRFVEHVAAHPASPRRWIESAIAKPCSWLYEDCQLCRDTGHLIEHAGFSRADIDRHRFKQSLFFPVNSAISGTGSDQTPILHDTAGMTFAEAVDTVWSPLSSPSSRCSSSSSSTARPGRVVGDR
jgi:SAM-dependent methyltransferase